MEKLEEESLLLVIDFISFFGDKSLLQVADIVKYIKSLLLRC
jgi:hypothetical protein